MIPDFTQFGLWLNIAIFAGAAAAVWFAGVRMAHYADVVSRKTGISHAVAGLVMLALVTSLPEIGVTVTAAAAGNGPLAVNNLFGSIAMQVAVLAVIDLVVSRRALTSVVPDPSVLLLGSLNVILLALACMGMVAGDVAFLGIGLWSWACLAGYLLSVRLLAQSDRRAWVPAQREDAAPSDTDEADAPADERGPVPRAVMTGVLVAASVILVAGYALSGTGDAIARQTGLGSSFVGFALLAVSTSLPEFSTALAAARKGHFTMAISDILGTNMINVGLLFVIDLVASGQPVLNTTGSFATFGALLGIAVTGLFLAGISERRDKTIARMGIDSLSVLIVYSGGLILLYTMR